MKTLPTTEFTLRTKLAVFKTLPNSRIVHCDIVSHDYKDIEMTREFYHAFRAITQGQPRPLLVTGLKLKHTNPVVRRMVKNHILPLVSYSAIVVPSGLSKLYGFMCKIIGGNTTIDHVFTHNYDEAVKIMFEAEKFQRLSA